MLKSKQKQKNPLISVIIPVYNMEKYVEQSINSVRFQTFKDIEIIAVNDGSTDNSLEVMQKLARQDKRIKIINKENAGLSSAYNAGQRIAIGKYIYFLDSDDWLEPDCLSKMLAIAEETGVEVVKSYGFIAERSGSAIERVMIPPKKCNQVITNMLLIPEMVSRHVAQWTCLYRRDFLINNDIWCPEYPKNMSPDTDFMYHVWCCCNSLFVMQKSFVHYRIDSDNSVKNSGSAMSFRMMRGHIAARATMVNLAVPQEFWFVETYVEFEHFIYELATNRCSTNRLDYLKAMSEIFKENIRHNLVDFKAFNFKRRITYKTIAWFPWLYWLNISLKIYTQTINRRTNAVTFWLFGGIYKKLIEEDADKTYLCGHLIKNKTYKRVYNYANSK